jgi:hypothetical protein
MSYLANRSGKAKMLGEIMSTDNRWLIYHIANRKDQSSLSLFDRHNINFPNPKIVPLE